MIRFCDLLKKKFEKISLKTVLMPEFKINKNAKLFFPIKQEFKRPPGSEKYWLYEGILFCSKIIQFYSKVSNFGQRFGYMRELWSFFLENYRKIYRRRFGTFVQNLVPKMIFLNGELYIILKLSNLEIGEHLSFFNYSNQVYLTRP